MAIVGFVAATLGAACETGLSVGYSIAQYFGWQWGKYVRPDEAARFHLVLALATILATGVLLTTVDPILVTEFSVVFSAVALPLTYFPILVVANDPDYMGEHVNGPARQRARHGLPRRHRRGRGGRDPADDRHPDGSLTWPTTTGSPAASTPSCTCSTGRSSTSTGGWSARSTTSSSRSSTTACWG